MSPTHASLVLTATFLLGLLGFGGPVQAATAEVRDEANFFSADAQTRAEKIIKEIGQRYKKDLLIETMRQVPADKREEANSSDEKAKRRFFANWAIQRARAEGLNGIYVLITREPGHVEIAVGNQTRTVFPDEARQRLSQLLLDHFRRKEFDEGLLAAVQEVRSVLATAPTAGPGATVGPGADATSNHNRPAHNRRAAPGGWGGTAGGSWLRWLSIGLAVLVGVWLLSALMRAFSGTQPRPAGAAFGGPGPGGAPYAGYGGPGYGGYGTGGGGFFTSLMGGLFGAAAGSWLYDQFSGGHSHLGGPGSMGGLPTTGTPDQRDTDYSAEGGDFDQPAEAYEDDRGGGFPEDNSSSGSGGDFGGGGGGDFGGGDFGGGSDTTSGGDF
jgi:uncharacterized membrane protein YgcG